MYLCSQQRSSDSQIGRKLSADYNPPPHGPCRAAARSQLITPACLPDRQRLCHRPAMNRRENERLIRAIDNARQAGQRIAIATVVRVRGSAYRREGARIVVREDRSYECLLSGDASGPVVAEIAAQVSRRPAGNPGIRPRRGFDLEPGTRLQRRGGYPYRAAGRRSRHQASGSGSSAGPRLPCW